ncbi:APC family amino acid-polyamine-organocation transporter [Companilactobacillus tucceti DSM 20183]|uniref:APC family amino acid-polyamine-organocation transporter n=1 Tax=Companilactobacillus tucceti DSM 20183 TaxID=1423811 RepID=A0A0R1JC34_9LACO|nr:amino acid permease [Companilactobacillus tucceti]KRK65282.1 APC family amino acid-polyamine-organocation transporter [Companilactobacillus tucceti DSM 20183]
MQEETENTLSRSLGSRHIQMIAIGGAIGTGLFLGSGDAIHESGPSIILAYMIAGIFCFFMMRAIGELLLSDTNEHSFLEFIRRYLGDRFEFAAGWAYWLCWITVAMADLTASGIYIRYWFPEVPQWLSALVILILLFAMNFVDVKLFGEMESGFSTIKVVAIILLVVIGFGMAIFRFPVDGGGNASFSNLFNQGGFFPTGFEGFVTSFQMVIFAFVGIEMVGITAGETSDPEVNLPKAINSLPIRIGLFYVGSMIAIMSVYPWDKITTTASPFVQVFSGIGIKGAAGILNFVVLTAALSATNSCLFSTSRTLYSLSLKGNAPKKFNIIGKNGVPLWALIFSAAALLVIVILNFFIPSDVFGIIATVSTINFIIIWMILIFCHLLYRKKHPEGTKAFLMPLYPFSNYLSLLFFGSILVLLLFLKSTRIPMLVTIAFWIVLLVIYGKRTIKKA